MASEAKRLQVYQSGKLTVVGFGGEEVLDRLEVASCREEILGIVQESQCETLAFDMTGVRLIPSGMLGLLASLRQLGVEVHIYNPSPDVREVLEITRLDRLMPIYEVEL